MTAQLPNLTLPKGAAVNIHIEVTAQVNITPYVARQRVAQFIIQHLSSQLLPGTPELRVGERLLWCVPIDLASPARGIVGRVGEVLVDVETGEVLADEDTVKRIDANAQDLARRSPL